MNNINISNEENKYMTTYEITYNYKNYKNILMSLFCIIFIIYLIVILKKYN